MCCKVAETGGPFFERRGCLAADRTNGALNDIVATYTHFDNVLAAVAFKNATVFAPESTFRTGKNCLTLHRYSFICRFFQQPVHE
jgi:hypothetical protein